MSRTIRGIESSQIKSHHKYNRFENRMQECLTCGLLEGCEGSCPRGKIEEIKNRNRYAE